MPGEQYDIQKLLIWKQTNSKNLLSINPVLRALVDGICDENSPLSIFIGLPHVLQMIWTIVTEAWKKMIKEGIDINSRSQFYGMEPSESIAFAQLNATLKFPKPKNIYINMMPFVMETSFEKCKLPKNLKHYWNEIINKDYYFEGTAFKLITENQYGKIGFLTIHESYVEKNKTHRRAGIHTDCPGKLTIAPNKGGEYICIGRVGETEEEEVINNIQSKVGGGMYNIKLINYTYRWGLGTTYSGTRYGCELIGGIYMASNISDSCEVWDCRVLQDEKGEEIIGNLGDVEHLREYLPKHETMAENEMYWITDRTPHESLPMVKGTYRQYFRLVTSEVSIWFEEHSTKNPLGVVPDPAITKIVKGSKFGKNNLLLLDLEPDTTPPGKEDQKKRYVFHNIFMLLDMGGGGGGGGGIF